MEIKEIKDESGMIKQLLIYDVSTMEQAKTHVQEWAEENNCLVQKISAEGNNIFIAEVRGDDYD